MQSDFVFYFGYLDSLTFRIYMPVASHFCLLVLGSWMSLMLCKAVFGLFLSYFIKPRAFIYILINIRTVSHNHSSSGSLVPKKVI